MEIKATLNKPYTDKQRTDFIVSENHQKGYQIKETETALEAWGFTDEEIATQQKISEYKKELKEIDEKSARSMRAKLAGTSTDADDVFLANLEAQATEIRQKIKELQEN